jgi:hypothetical protein
MYGTPNPRLPVNLCALRAFVLVRLGVPPITHAHLGIIIRMRLSMSIMKESSGVVKSLTSPLRLMGLGSHGLRLVGLECLDRGEVVDEDANVLVLEPETGTQSAHVQQGQVW